VTVISRFLDQAAHTPDAVALTCIEDERAWTYAELRAEVEGWAASLQERGVGPGDRVSAVMEQRPESVLLHLALLRLGAVLHPIGTSATPAEVAGLIEDIEPSLVVAPGQDLGGTGRSDAPLPGEDDLACILSTSGTTGRPKGSLTTHGNLVANADALVEAWGISSSDTILHLLPLHHVHGLFVAIHPFLLTGGSVVLGRRFSPDTVVAHIDRATVLMGVPTFYTRLLDDDRVGHDLLGHMRLFTSGSAPLLAATHREWEQRTGHRILERYGMTEIQMALSNPLDGERRAGTVGMPLPGLEARVRSASGSLVGVGEAGVLEVRGPTVSPGYWRRPDATEESRTDDGWFITGDVVTKSRDGYHAIVGRTSDMIISGGLNVYPKEVEDVIDGVPGVVESAVIGVPHPDFGEAVLAVCVGEAEDEAVMATARTRLSAYKVPKAIEWVPELPRNSMGKVQKAALRDRFAGRFDA
jgi:malonyl-CoA/methylmalonyl-CoA synthetase